jgi:hypothetical protein
VKSGRFFVTSVVLFAMAAFVACDGHRSTRERAGQDQHDANQKAAAEKEALVNEGNAKITEAQALQKQLAAEGVVISSEAKSIREQSVRTKDLNEKLTGISLERRRSLQGRLAQYLQLINRVIEIDSKNLITIDNRDMIFTSRNSAEILQKNVEEFERAHGESFNPKSEIQQPPKAG